MKKLFCLAAFLLVFGGLAQAENPKALFYLTRDPKSVRSFMEHASQIDILVPAWYSVDADGLVSGGPNPAVIEKAKAAHTPVMPIVANDASSQEPFHKLLGDIHAQSQMVDQLIEIAKQNGYTGWQFDFENVNWTDRDALSRIVELTADRLHKAGLQLTIATVPNAPGLAGETGYAKWMFANWRGAYDLAALARYVDLICLMTYDQHTRYTPPGPVGGWGWTNENLDYALKVVPPQKLSLGIAIYGYHWFSGTPQKPEEKPNPTAEYISGSDALDLAKAYGGAVQWDPVDKSAWLYFYRDDEREWIFFTDKRTFEARYDLAKQKGLQGFCSWDLGDEDPDIWSALPSHK
ncbi:glycosyl hydrolase family 18 protein [Silvibacterium dinghuense]|uniref:Glycosyl hydrolase n=1 Tax=Silvibacterium dinghuense TaxID=1560006 RepID=A0A4Q1SHX6_9BACT|nr:glycosyl hydrolase family 18 protein [Silvibacterium dinghuense]RXS96977.1 glycosyl hydrolase [Silvibacterium dinghuense]GGG95165.1 glycosyl hydrolase [Silvibacterium dinghuense]